MSNALHPDQLKPGDMVGPWSITQVLGRGGSSRVFKVERDGRPYSMKVALQPFSNSWEKVLEVQSWEQEHAEERTAWRRLAREAATLFTYSSHPNLLRVYGVDFWPSPSMGYPFLVTDYVDGDTWHEWRWRTPPHAVNLVHTFSDVVRTVGELHVRGVYHRDLKAENILVRRVDGRPFLIDFGTARLPGTLTQTMGLPEGVLHLLPPELLAYARSEAWRRGKPFQGGVSADLYALGALLYQALSDLHPFNPELPDKELAAVIATLPPVAPHLLNPKAPRSLSDIAMKLLEKRPEDRYPSAEALLQALEKAAEEGRTSPAWKMPLFGAEGSLIDPPHQETLSLPAQPLDPAAETLEATNPGRGGEGEGVAQLPPQPGTGRTVPEESPSSNERQALPETPLVRPRGARWPVALFGSLTLVVLALWLARPTLAPSPEAMPPGSGRPEKGSLPVPTTLPSPVLRLTAWLCAVAGLGCAAAQVKPPEPADCPQEATQSMFQELKIRTGSDLQAIVDINQPGDRSEEGTYSEGAIIGRLTKGAGNLPEGTLLHGRLWTGPGIYDLETGKELPAVMGRYNLAILPDGRKFPVCIVLGNPDGRVPRFENSTTGAAVLNREFPVSAVWRWP